MKKLLLCIGVSILITTFIGTTFLFVLSMTEYIPFLLDSEEVLSEMETSVKEIREDTNISDYKIASSFYWLRYDILLNIVEIYTVSLITGIIAGTIIYTIAIKKVKGKKLAIFIITLFIMFTLLVRCADYATASHDISILEIFIGYSIILLITYLGFMLYQKSISNKLNKELNKK